MKKKLYSCWALLTICLLLTCMHSYADGSKNLYPSGALGYRAFLISYSPLVPVNNWPFLTEGVHYAYVKAGETITAASSAQGIGKGRIILTAPDGTVYTSKPAPGGGLLPDTGYIADRTQELAGPYAANGYIPFSQLAGAGQQGVWEIKFIATRVVASFNQAGATGTANLNWTGQHSSSSAIRAWDVSVMAADSSMISGRVYNNIMNMYTGGGYFGKMYVLTNDGYTYQVDNNGHYGIGFMCFVNNKGLTIGTGDNASPSYKSLNSLATIPVKDPREPDGVQTVTHKMFYTMPDPGLPKKGVLPGGDSTWLRTLKVLPTISNISIKGVEGTNAQISSKGAVIKFDANMIGGFRIDIIGPGFVPRIMTGTAVLGNNTLNWDGLDGIGAPLSPGILNMALKIQLKGAEVHFPFVDLEQNPRGMILKQLNDDGTMQSDIVYWDDSDIISTSMGPSNPAVNGNDGLGISSTLNGHKWSNNYGDEKVMDTWAYVLGNASTQNTPLDIKEADLEVLSVAPATPITSIAVGQQITYSIPVINNGPSDAAGAPFKFKLPAGLVIGPLSNVTFTTACGTVNSPAIDGNGDYTALLDLPNGCQVNFSVTATVGASLLCQPIPVEASIMRPNDVTDPDATNPDPGVPPTDPHVECLNGTATETCNNIKYNNAVTVSTPLPVSGGDKEVCEGMPIPVLTATVPAGFTITWYDAPTGGNVVTSPTLSAPGIVTYYAASGNGTCVSAARTPVKLTVHAEPGLVINNPVPVCLPGTVNLTAAAVTLGSEADLTFGWFTNAAGTTAMANPAAVAVSGTYYIKATHNVTGCTVIRPVTVVLVDRPVVAVGEPVCIGENGSIAITSPLGADYTYSIDGIAYQPSPVFLNVAPATYQVTARNTVSGCTSLAATATINSAAAAPTPVVTQPGCGATGGVIELPQYIGATYSINNGGSFVNTHVFSNLAPGPYTAIVKSTNGCNSLGVSIVINAVPAVPAPPVSGGDQQVCAVSPVQTLTATATVGAGETLTWYDAATGGNIVSSPVRNAVGTVTYYAEANNGTCVSSSRTPVTLTIAVQPIIQPIADVSSCGSYTLPAITGTNLTGNEAYYTSAGGNGTQYSIGDQITTPGTITLYAYDVTTGVINCPAEESFDVTINSHPAPPASGGDQNVCATNPVQTLTATATAPAGVTITWYDAATAGNIVTSPVLNTVGTKTYYAEASDGTCSSTSRTAVVLTIRVTPVLTPVTNITTCDAYTLPAIQGTNLTGNQAYYTATGGGGTQYNAGDVITTTGTTQLFIYDETALACADEKSFNITIGTTPAVPVSGGDQEVCEAVPVQTLTATATAPVGMDIVWYDEAVGGTEVEFPILDAPGTVIYYAETVNGNCKSATRTPVSLTIKSAPLLVITDPAPVCAGNAVDLTAAAITLGSDAGLTYTYYSDAGITIVPTPAAVTAAGTYYILATNTITTCTILQPVTVQVLTPPVSNAGADQEQFNSGSFVLAAVDPATGSGAWSVVSGTPAVGVSDLTDKNGTITLSPNTTVTLRWTVTSGSCSDADDVILTYTSNADIVTVKQLKDNTQTSFAPGEEVVYTIRVTNNGPSDASSVNMVDNAPAGTTIAGWTATVTTGTVVLPNASGTGNLNETIATLPNGAVVKYEVTVQTPVTFTGSLINTATVTSPTPDPVPACPACTTTPLVTVNVPPVATDNTSATKEGSKIIIDILDNDTPGPGGSPLVPSSLEIVSRPAHGTLTINPDGTVVYTPDPGFKGTDSFTYRIQDANGEWSNVATVSITIEENKLEIPNVITPNGDGHNDKFVIKGLEKYTHNSLLIFNRWNNKVYERKGYPGEWDGNGLNAGTYFYTLKVQDVNGQWLTFNGYITLLR